MDYVWWWSHKIPMERRIFCDVIALIPWYTFITWGDVGVNNKWSSPVYESRAEYVTLNNKSLMLLWTGPVLLRSSVGNDSGCEFTIAVAGSCPTENTWQPFSLSSISYIFPPFLLWHSLSLRVDGVSILLRAEHSTVSSLGTLIILESLRSSLVTGKRLIWVRLLRAAFVCG